MAIEDADIMIVMKPFSEWTSASSRAEMVEKMKAALDTIPDVEFNFSQPIQLRFNELMTGAKADIAIKLYGDDMEELYSKAREAAKYIEQIPGAADVLVEQAMGLPQLVVNYNRSKLARYGINVKELNSIIRTAYAGEVAGTVFENERRFDLVLRLDRKKLQDFNLNKFFIRTADGIQIPVTELAQVELVSGPLQINRDATRRRIVTGVNVRGADIQQVVEKIQSVLDENIKLKPGYYFEYGGQFENLQNAINTLLIVIPIALLLILLLLFFAFRNLTGVLVVFSTVPLSMTGGVLALWIRGLPFSISAGVGFIALFGVSVLNGILMLNHFKTLSKSTDRRMATDKIIMKGTPHLLRPVFLTGLVASLGFVPMAIATSAGAEVQRPLATVVIGGLFVSTFLTLIIIPVFYHLAGVFSVCRRKWKKRRIIHFTVPAALLLIMTALVQAQQTVTLDEVIAMAKQNNLRLKSATASIDRSKAAKGESWDLGATSFDYSWGQLNGTVRNDRQFTVTQSSVSFITPFYRNSLVKHQENTSTSNRNMVEKEIVAEAKRAWAYYQYAYHKKQMLGEQNKLAALLLRTGDLRYKQGEITLLEKNMTSAQAAFMKNRVFQAEEELKLAAARLQWVCYSETPVIPADTLLSKYDTNIISAELSHAHLSYFNSKIYEAEAIVKIERSRFFPEFSTGWQRQNILPDKGLNSWIIGISVPLIFNAQSSRLKQAKYDACIAKYEAENNIRQLGNKVFELKAELRKYDESISFFETSALHEADAMIRSAELQLKHSETDMGNFIQSMNSALDIKQAYIEMIYQYNISVLEYELYSN
jgi:cobalt-zinc-cadmium resistance protein CzcA